MSKTVIMPKLGFTQETAQIVQWLKAAGDTVEQGDPLLEVTTDKVNMEVESPATGILDGLRFKAGDIVPVTEVIAVIRDANEPAVTPAANAPGNTEPAATQPAAGTPEGASARATPIAAHLAHDSGVDISRVAGTGPGGRVTRTDVEGFLAKQPETGKPRAVPAARKLAQETGVNLAEVKGSGPRGRIQSADVRAATPAKAPQVATEVVTAEAMQPAPEKASVSEAGVAEIIPLTGIRQTIAQRMQQSVREAPHITLEADIDVSEAEALRARANELLKQDQPRISLTAVIARACAWALKRNPFLNSRLIGQQIQVLRDVNIGIAVALDVGLIVPVVHGIDMKGLAAIAAELTDLATRARAGKLRIEDVTGGTFSISNLGMFGVDRFTAIINPPETAILAVGRVTRRFVPDAEGRPVLRPLMTVTLSADHRVVDGATAGRFLNDVRQVLEHPELFVM
jgi:pyruvate dehydrogenase E2 component (dihydrolipoamide acetyltransferase)